MNYSGELKIIAGAALFSLIPVCVLYGSDVSIPFLMFGRLLVATVILFFLKKECRRFFNIPAKKMLLLMAWSLLMLGAMFSYFMAIQYSGIAISSALLGTQPLLVVLVAALFLKEKISKRTLFAGILTLAGIICITGFGNVMNKDVFIGELLAICSALLLAFNFVLPKKYFNEYKGEELTFFQSLFQLPFLLPFLFWGNNHLSISSASSMLVLGIVCTVISYSLIYSGIKQVSGQKIGILQSIEYVIPVFIGIFFFREEFSLTAFAGMSIVIVSCVMVGKKQEC